MKRKKLLVILITVLLIGTVATVAGVSVAYWSETEGGAGQIAPQTTTTDWNYWSKYFIYEEISVGGNVTGYRIVGFEGTVLENVVIPRSYNGKPVRMVGNSTFANTTDKSIPVTITIPTSVDVEPGAFNGLGNLTTVKVVIVMDSLDQPDTAIDIGSSAFFGCNNVTKFVVDGSIMVSKGLLKEFTINDIKFWSSGQSASFAELLTKTGLPTNLTPTLQ